MSDVPDAGKEQFHQLGKNLLSSGNLTLGQSAIVLCLKSENKSQIFLKKILVEFGPEPKRKYCQLVGEIRDF